MFNQSSTNFFIFLHIVHQIFILILYETNIKCFHFSSKRKKMIKLQKNAIKVFKRRNILFMKSILRIHIVIILLFEGLIFGLIFESKFLFQNNDFLFEFINHEIDFEHFLFRVISHFIDVVCIIDEILV